MNSNFYAAGYAFLLSCAVSWLTSEKGTQVDGRLLILRAGPVNRVLNDRLLWVLAACLLAACIAMNVFWR